MAVGFDSRAIVAANFADNLCRWKERGAGHYEVWLLTLNQRARQRGFWFRYAMVAPKEAHSGIENRAELWATFFDRSRPDKNFGIVRHYPIDTFKSQKDCFNLRIEESVLSSTQAKGQLANAEHSIIWNLQFTPNQATYFHVPKGLGILTRPSSTVCSPNLNTSFSGIVTIDGRQMMLENEQGCQIHLWGSKQVDEWIWVHANAFEKHEGTVFEGLTARSRRAGRTLPPIQSLFLRHRGEEHHFIRMRFAEQWQRNLGVGYWSFAAMNTQIYLEGTAQCRLKDMLQAGYVDPDGEPLYCINSEVANLKIRVFRRVHGLRWRHVETISARATAHMEHASRSADEQVRLI
jgi:hypothetical protein